MNLLALMSGPEDPPRPLRALPMSFDAARIPADAPVLFSTLSIRLRSRPVPKGVEAVDGVLQQGGAAQRLGAIRIGVIEQFKQGLGPIEQGVTPIRQPPQGGEHQHLDRHYPRLELECLVVHHRVPPLPAGVAPDLARYGFSRRAREARP